jgi:UDP-N-acetylmuramate--alanine ligase
MKFKVTGSDIQRSEITRKLQARGIKVHYRHSKENVHGADVVVYSTAVPKDNVELAEAYRQGITVIHRGELLAELTRMKVAVCVSGTHGKTTTTSIIGEVLQYGDLSPTTLVGGVVRGKSQANIGKGDYLVCEADESDKSFLRLYPSYAVITNIEAEHLDHYANLDEIKENFVHFANHVPFWGCTFIGADTKGALDILSRISRRIVTYGTNEHAQLRARNIRKGHLACMFDVTYHDERIGQFTSQLLGTHNISNMVAAIGVGLELGIPVPSMKKALKEFKGVHRRIECHGAVRGVLIFDDYGHHPTEIAVTLQTIREYYPNRRIISVFQPHRYTRTYHLFNDFAYSFFGADMVVITKIYAAHEIPIPGITGESLAKRVRKEQEAVHYISEFDDIITFLRSQVRKGDIVVVQGAGDINHLATRMMKEFA